MPTTTDLKYTAGLFDARGSILLHKTSYDNWKYPKVRLCVTPRRFAILDWLKETYGGCISNCGDGRKYWIVQNQQAIEFLTSIRPYIKLPLRKQQLAMILDEYPAYELNSFGRATYLQKRKRSGFQNRFKKLTAK